MALVPWRKPLATHDPGKILLDLAIAVALGGDCLADINQVLAIEPRHFGAIAGLAAILTSAGKDELALEAWQRFLDIYPSERQAQEQLGELAEKLAGKRT